MAFSLQMYVLFLFNEAIFLFAYLEVYHYYEWLCTVIILTLIKTINNTLPTI